MNKLIGVYGAPGCGVGIMPLIREQYLDAKIVFIDDKKSNGLLNGHQIIDWAEFLEESSKQKFVSVKLQNSSKNNLPLNKDFILCNHCKRTASNGIRCMGICVADSDY